MRVLHQVSWLSEILANSGAPENSWLPSPVRCRPTCPRSSAWDILGYLITGFRRTVRWTQVSPEWPLDHPLPRRRGLEALSSPWGS